MDGYNVEMYFSELKFFLKKKLLHIFCMIYNFTIAVSDNLNPVQKFSLILDNNVIVNKNLLAIHQ